MMDTTRQWDVVVIGAGGTQAQAMLQAAAKIGPLQRWLCADLAWRPDRREETEKLGATTIQFDALQDSQQLAELAGAARVVANMVGPYFRTIGPVLDACITGQADYLDICDDADAAASIIERDEEVKAAGITALSGMGATPGTSNVMVRAALDVMKSADQVDICWINDARDASPAALEHMWHIFRPHVQGSQIAEVPEWDDLSRKNIEFAEGVGTHLTFELAHSELVTLPHYLDVGVVTNYGGLAPADSLILVWAMARMGAGDERCGRPEFDSIAQQIYGDLVSGLEARPRVLGGMRIDVLSHGSGLRFQSASHETMEESTGTPAAAGALLLLDGCLPDAGVFAPECIVPVDFFDRMRQVSEPSGSMAVFRMRDGEPQERISLRQVLTAPHEVRNVLAGIPASQ